MKNTIKKFAALAAAFALSLGIAATPVAAQTSGTSTYTPPTTTTTCTTNCTTPTPTPAPSTCSTGNACPIGGSTVIIGSAAFNGIATGQFGAIGSDGKIVAGNGVSGKIDVAKYGEGEVKVGLVGSSNLCVNDCTTQKITYDGYARERVLSSVTAQSTTPAQSVAVANFGQANAGVLVTWNTTRTGTTIPTP